MIQAQFVLKIWKTYIFTKTAKNKGSMLLYFFYFFLYFEFLELISKLTFVQNFKKIALKMKFSKTDFVV